MSEAQDDPALVAAQDYEKNVVTYTMIPITAILLEHDSPQPGEHVVDVGCGTGVVARQTAPRVGAAGTVVGVDIDPAMLTVARSLPAPEGASIDWREGNASALPLPDDAFDLALCQAGLQFFPDRLVALQEMHRVLRPGGRVALSVARSLEHNPASQTIWEAIARHLNTRPTVLVRQFSLGDAGELRALLEAAGFVDVTIVARSYTVRQPRNPQLICADAGQRGRRAASHCILQRRRTICARRGGRTRDRPASTGVRRGRRGAPSDGFSHCLGAQTLTALDEPISSSADTMYKEPTCHVMPIPKAW